MGFVTMLIRAGQEWHCAGRWRL